MKKLKKSMIFNYMSVAVMIALLVLHFIPFWNYDEGSASMQAYIWFPNDYRKLTKFLQDLVGKDYSINQIVLPVVAPLVTFLVGIFFEIFKPSKPIMNSIPIVGALLAIWGFITQPALQAGSTWLIQLVLCVVVLVLSVLGMIFGLIEKE